MAPYPWLGALFVVLSLAIRLPSLAPDAQTPDSLRRERDVDLANKSVRALSQEALCGIEVGVDLPLPLAAPDPYVAPEPALARSLESGSDVEEISPESGERCTWRNVIQPMVPSVIPTKAELRSCALVGSSADMMGRGLGREIDEHDHVIRVNRIPTPEYSTDFGNRTDIFFAGALAEGSSTYNLAGQDYRDFGGAVRTCPWLGHGCPFHTLVLKASDQVECGSSFEGRFPTWSPGWVPPSSDLVVGHQTDAVNTLAYHLLTAAKGHGVRPTNGFQAFLTFAYACKRLDTYGFSGARTADGHDISDIHDLDVEHLIMQHISAGYFCGRAERSVLFTAVPHFQSCVCGGISMRQ